MSSIELSNPLIAPSDLPHGAPPFDKIKTEHYLPAIEWAIEKAHEALEAIKNQDDLPTFENTIEALEFCDTDLSRIGGIFGMVANANSSDEIRDLEEVIDRRVAAFSNELILDDVLFARIEAVYNMRDKLALDQEQRTLLEKTYRGFARQGATLPPAQKDRLREISEELAKLSTTYSKNIVKSTQAYRKVISDEQDLAGVPERAKKLYAEAATENGQPGQWLIPLSPPPVDILDYAENRSLREEIYKAMQTVASTGAEDNSPIVLDIVRLRHEKAQLLGYNTYADYVLEDRMAGNTQTVMDFLERNRQAYKPVAEKELKEIQDYALQKDGLADLKPWDVGYYSRLLQEEKFDIDLEELRPYFELETVIEGLHAHLDALFGVETVDKSDVYPSYHPDVKVFEVTDKQSGELLGIFYGDYYARPGAKRNGAWHVGAQTHSSYPGRERVTINTNVCNFDKPAKDSPSLLSWDQYTTLFHERGHAMHALLARGKYPSLTGTNVKRDFVETQSQLQERWATAEEVLKILARHHETGAPIPMEYIRKLKDMENCGVGMSQLRQTFLGLLDMKWHTTDPATITGVEDIEGQVAATASIMPRQPGAFMSTRFGHLFSGGYAAGYYGYKWTEGLCDDIFADFEAAGLYDPATAQRLRDTIYAPGGTRDPMELFVAMKGREPDPNAMYRREGILDIANDNDDTPAITPRQNGTGPNP